MATTAALSQKQDTERPFPSLPHVATPSTMGNSSFTVMCKSLQHSGNRSWNHFPPEVKAPQPQEPEASEVNATWGGPRHRVAIGHEPFQIGKKQPHHLRSERKPALSRTRWWSSLTHLYSSIIRRKNDLPGLIAQHACCSWPIMDSSALLEQDFMPSHRRISRRSRSSLVGGSRTVTDSVSNSSPRKVRVALGPSVFQEATGTPNMAQRAKANCRALSPCLESGSPKAIHLIMVHQDPQ